MPMLTIKSKKTLNEQTGEWEQSTIYLLDGREVSKEEADAQFPDKSLEGGGPGGMHPACWPMKGVALAVHESQVAEANARNERHGIATRYAGDGTAIIPSPGDYKKLRKLEGVHFNNGIES